MTKLERHCELIVASQVEIEMCSRLASLLEVLLINWRFFQLSICASGGLQLRTRDAFFAVI